MNTCWHFLFLLKFKFEYGMLTFFIYISLRGILLEHSWENIEEKMTVSSFFFSKLSGLHRPFSSVQRL